MSDDDQEQLFEGVALSRRKMLKRILLGSAAVYAAPMITSFGLDAASAGTPPKGGNQTAGPPRGGNQTGRHPRGGNQTTGHPRGGNQTGRHPRGGNQTTGHHRDGDHRDGDGRGRD